MSFASVVETHTAALFFVGDRVYKMKKPVRFDFVDFTSRDARRAACHREVELNRRLAPDVYIGVADVVGPDGSPCEHMVVMRRLPADRRLSTLVEAGASVDRDLRQIARQLANFHSVADTGPAIDEAAGADTEAKRWHANFAELTNLAGNDLDRQQIDSCNTLAASYIAGRGPLFARRIQEGRARDGHGDLLADDIFCIGDQPRIIDCLDFDDQLRWGDTAADVAFLAMDLERIGRRDLSGLFLDAYAEYSGDAWPASLMHHYVAYRALVRAKVGCIRRDQGDSAGVASAIGLLEMAQQHLFAARVRLILVGGLPGTGKSTLAAGIGNALGATVLRSDRIRKELAGLEPTTHAFAPFGEGIYSSAASDRTYQEIVRRAEVGLGMGETVVLDASWRDARWRERARELAASTHAELIELCCRTDPLIAAARIDARNRADADLSDATPAVMRSMQAAWPAWTSAVEVDTTRAAPAVLGDVLPIVR